MKRETQQIRVCQEHGTEHLHGETWEYETQREGKTTPQPCEIETETTPREPFEWLDTEVWLSFFDREEIERALKRLHIRVEDLTDKQDFENKPYHTKAELIKDWHTTNYIRVYKDVVIDGQYIQMEGYKKGKVRTFRIPAQYQGLKHGEIIHEILKTRFKWFNKFEWSIYELRGSDTEIYAKTSEGSLYVPLKAFFSNNAEAIIKERMKKYYSQYRKTSSYELNKKKGETLQQFDIRKEAEYKQDILPLETKEAKELFKLLRDGAKMSEHDIKHTLFIIVMIISLFILINFNTLLGSVLFFSGAITLLVHNYYTEKYATKEM